MNKTIDEIRTEILKKVNEANSKELKDIWNKLYNQSNYFSAKLIDLNDYYEDYED